MRTLVKARLSRLKTETRDLLELVLVPGLAAVLPWRVCFALFKRLSYWQWLYRDACQHALGQARQRGWVEDEAHWLATRRLITLIDHADFYLARTRSDRWMRRHLSVDGEWPSADTPSILCTFHWGAGMWGLRHARANQMRVHALVAPLNGAHFTGRTVLHQYAKARTACVTTTLGQQTLDVSSSLRPALRALKGKDQVLAAIDVPADQVASSYPIELLGMKARVPRALLRLAVDHAIPVTVFVTGVRLSDGHRFLRIYPFGTPSDLETLIPAIFSKLEDAIRENPPAWHFWGESERFFVRSAD